MLFVPGDSEKKIAKSETFAPDAVILDLEDSVATANKAFARQIVTNYLTHANRRCALYVRINPLDTVDALADLTAIMEARPDGIMLPKARSPQDCVQLSHYLDAFEAQHGTALGHTRIVPVATEVAEAVFALGNYASVGARLAGITWGAEDLAAAIGATDNRDERGEWNQPFELTRSLCLFGASAAKVAAIDTLHADYKDEAGLAASSRRARRDGFAGRLAIHPAQVAIINEAFTPSEAEVTHAHQVVALFAANPGAGTLGLNGKMLDMPHLIQAQKILTLAKRGQ